MPELRAITKSVLLNSRNRWFSRRLQGDHQTGRHTGSGDRPSVMQDNAPQGESVDLLADELPMRGAANELGNDETTQTSQSVPDSWSGEEPRGVPTQLGPRPEASIWPDLTLEKPRAIPQDMDTADPEMRRAAESAIYGKHLHGHPELVKAGAKYRPLRDGGGPSSVGRYRSRNRRVTELLSLCR